MKLRWPTDLTDRELVSRLTRERMADPAVRDRIRAGLATPDARARRAAANDARHAAAELRRLRKAWDQARSSVREGVLSELQLVAAAVKKSSAAEEYSPAVKP